ncbi:MAG: hypothetical protein OZSIB_1775 [Candidatus Ozemobacter sibiricus]|jgi:hypothetical protein|uniref:Uncharacterized protein n=1 Tax=Candidatus Ozemobacter sibiricus TaxID=2268124 RepID=A0A367ZJ56_9BACT|nr:MAG: hypothetical protein OZSIB_1775 [Candidatus Ozemobacter sibiricus]
MYYRWLLVAGIVFLMFVLSLPAQADIDERIAEMITAYSAGTKGVNDPVFQEKVNELDNELRERLEKDLDISPFQKLLAAAHQMKARKAARAMFEVALSRAQKRLTFTKTQQEITDPETIKRIDEMTQAIERYLDPSLPDDDTVDAQALTAKRKARLAKIEAMRQKLAQKPLDQRITLEVTDEQGQPARLTGSRAANLLAKIKTVVTDPGEMNVQVSLKSGDQFDLHIAVKNFIAPTGFAVREGELDFVGVPLAALDDSNPSEVAEVLGDTHFKRYRVVQDDEQLNVVPHANQSTSYEMGSFMPGQSFKMEFKKPSGIPEVLKALEGDDRFQVLNAKTAVQDGFIEIKNLAARNLIFLQGTDVTGLVSVKAIGTLKPKDGHVAFSEVLLVVDDGLASDLTRFVGEQGINFFLKAASENMRKGLPFTPVLEEMSFEQSPDGRQLYIFSGRGKYNL